jgi:DNA-directed RNA polymerase specialized sigma24 family protein
LSKYNLLSLGLFLFIPLPQMDNLAKNNKDNYALWQTFVHSKQAEGSLVFRQVVERHYKPLLSYGTKLSKDADFVKDCIHDLFIHVWEKRQSLTHVKVPRFYLLGALRNQILKEIQQQKGARKTELMEDDYILDVEFALLEDQPLYDKMSIICDAINAQYQVLDGQIVVLSSGCK